LKSVLFRSGPTAVIIVIWTAIGPERKHASFIGAAEPPAT
jgi:hypothetical protein